MKFNHSDRGPPVGWVRCVVTSVWVSKMGPTHLLFFLLTNKIMIHNQPSPLAGKTVKIKSTIKGIGGYSIRVEDWYDRINGKSWMDSNGNPAAMGYAWRAGTSGLPKDNQVVYGKIEGSGYIVHLNELEDNPESN